MDDIIIIIILFFVVYGFLLSMTLTLNWRCLVPCIERSTASVVINDGSFLNSLQFLKIFRKLKKAHFSFGASASASDEIPEMVQEWKFLVTEKWWMKTFSREKRNVLIEHQYHVALRHGSFFIALLLITRCVCVSCYKLPCQETFHCVQITIRLHVISSFFHGNVIIMRKLSEANG